MSSKTQRAEKGIPNALARFGFFARGFVYVVAGGLAARVAIVQRGHALGPAGALAKILAGWNGRLALWIVAAGLLAFVLFRAAQCLRTRSRLARIGYAVVAVTGTSVFRAGLEGNPRGLSGTAAALRTIKGAENGPALVALAAAGLIAYDLSLLVLAAHRLKRSR
jgi:hypothetical protein